MIEMILSITKTTALAIENLAHAFHLHAVQYSLLFTTIGNSMIAVDRRRYK